MPEYISNQYNKINELIRSQNNKINTMWFLLANSRVGSLPQQLKDSSTLDQRVKPRNTVTQERDCVDWHRKTTPHITQGKTQHNTTRTQKEAVLRMVSTYRTIHHSIQTCQFSAFPRICWGSLQDLPIIFGSTG